MSFESFSSSRERKLESLTPAEVAAQEFTLRLRKALVGGVDERGEYSDEAKLLLAELGEAKVPDSFEDDDIEYPSALTVAIANELNEDYYSNLSGDQLAAVQYSSAAALHVHLLRNNRPAKTGELVASATKEVYASVGSDGERASVFLDALADMSIEFARGEEQEVDTKEELEELEERNRQLERKFAKSSSVVFGTVGASIMIGLTATGAHADAAPNTANSDRAVEVVADDVDLSLLPSLSGDNKAESASKGKSDNEPLETKPEAKVDEDSSDETKGEAARISEGIIQPLERDKDGNIVKAEEEPEPQKEKKKEESAPKPKANPKPKSESKPENKAEKKEVKKYKSQHEVNIAAAEKMLEKHGMDSTMGRAARIMELMLKSEKIDLTPGAISGFIGNFMHEAPGLKSDIKQFGGGPGRGLAQWEVGYYADGQAKRGQDLMKFADSRGTSWSDFDTQVHFVIHELTGKEKRAYNKVKTGSKVSDFAYLVRKFYERPSVHADKKRADYGNEVYLEFDKIREPIQAEFEAGKAKTTSATKETVRSAEFASDKTERVLPGADLVVAWAEYFAENPGSITDLCGTKNCSGMCGRATAVLWGHSSAGHISAAAMQAHAQRNSMHHTNPDNMPVGALVYYRGEKGLNSYGHVAVYIGDGRIATNMSHKNTYEIVSGAEAARMFGYEGWSEPIFTTGKWSGYNDGPPGWEEKKEAERKAEEERKEEERKEEERKEKERKAEEEARNKAASDLFKTAVKLGRVMPVDSIDGKDSKQIGQMVKELEDSVKGTEEEEGGESQEWLQVHEDEESEPESQDKEPKEEPESESKPESSEKPESTQEGEGWLQVREDGKPEQEPQPESEPTPEEESTPEEPESEVEEESTPEEPEAEEEPKEKSAPEPTPEEEPEPSEETDGTDAEQDRGANGSEEWLEIREDEEPEVEPQTEEEAETEEPKEEPESESKPESSEKPESTQEGEGWLQVREDGKPEQEPQPESEPTPEEESTPEEPEVEEEPEQDNKEQDLKDRFVIGGAEEDTLAQIYKQAEEVKQKNEEELARILRG